MMTTLDNMLSYCLLVWGLLLGTAAALVTPQQVEPVVNELVRRQTCNTASNRQCWTTSPAFNINTDYELSRPSTGVTRTYTFTLTQVASWTGGDGRTKTNAMLINGQFPGPTITANWGDRINVTIINNMSTNGTSIHYHGLRQKNTNNMDGVSGVTECPIAPTRSKTHSFFADQYGTAWYHSHFSGQYGNGLLGPIVINGPASANYDIDLGPLVISDWYLGSAFTLGARVSNPFTPFIPGFPGSPPNSDNVLFNGKNINPAGAGGSYQKFTLTSGQKHLVRIINSSVQNAFTLSLVGHSFQIVATDMVPITPVTVTSLFVGIGQRYDVIITANQAVGNYWFNATFSSAPCGISNNPRPAMIFQYSGAPNANPTNAGSTPPDSRCQDVLTYAPIVTRTSPSASFPASNTLNTKLTVNNGIAKVFWPVNNSPMKVNWNNPTLEYVQSNTVGSMPADANILQVPSANIWSFWLIQNNSSIPHPIHLHGHDILILGASPALANPVPPLPTNTLRPYNPSTDGPNLRLNNPTRRDTTMLPAWGWLAVAYRTNNPGAWLFHCHIAWHASQGLSVQFIEQQSAISTTMDLNELTANCNNWDAYYPSMATFPQDDSGI